MGPQMIALLVKLLNSPTAVPILGRVIKAVVPDKEWWKSLTVTVSVAWGLAGYLSDHDTGIGPLDQIADSIVALLGSPNVGHLLLFLGIRKAIVSNGGEVTVPPTDPPAAPAGAAAPGSGAAVGAAILGLFLLASPATAADTETFTHTVTSTHTSTSTATSTSTVTASATATATATSTSTVTCAVGCFSYVTNSSSNTMSVIDNTSNTLKTALFVGLKAFHVAVAPNGSRAYVSIDGRPGSLKVLDTSGASGVPAVIQGLPMGQQPRFVSVRGDNTVQAVSNFNLDQNSGVNLISAGSSKITTGDGPWGIAFSPDGSYLYVANHKRNTSSTVSAVNVSTKAITQISVGSGPRFVAFTPNGSWAYASNEASGTVTKINASTRSPAATIAVASKPWYVTTTADNSYAYVTRNTLSGGVSKIRVADDVVTATIATGDFPQFTALTPNGSFLYVANVNSGTVTVVNTATDAIAATVSLGAGTRPIFVAANPNGSFVYVTRNTNPGYVNTIRTSDNLVVATVTVGAYPVFVGVRPF